MAPGPSRKKGMDGLEQFRHNLPGNQVVLFSGVIATLEKSFTPRTRSPQVTPLIANGLHHFQTIWINLLSLPVDVVRVALSISQSPFQEDCFARSLKT